ncbi:putative heme oxygenase [Bradyrhizobium sp. ORS 285]|uniref:biliverdin-producing heme oxygenase n=1 Tax=Bradyrhizobium sp. ORS 285 TaxID=115808 RepID=UPI000240ABD5|nr:biliverdin-producing heme oxygenase [Bradyrhizobium sp. ORS 285]CCD87072.1 putative heme oxygenase [Bradyrhizobium sp. ORS 285]SMX60101.1 putative heme oxygenase [Bradyrhizobium sp. ORS 285]
MSLAAISDDSFHTATTGIRDRLKAATSAAHHALDERLGQYDLTTTAHYRRFLASSAAALLPLEQALEQAGVAAVIEAWPQRRRSEAIRADLAALRGHAAPLELSLPIVDRAAVFGTLYVLEGSRLGAAYLLRVVTASDDPRVRHATRYLRHGAGEGLWRSYLAQLECEPMTPDVQERMIASAQAAFAIFATAMAAA